MRKEFKVQCLKFKVFTRGFTLIELIVVIAIIGILATFLIVNFAGVRVRARDAQRKTDVKQIQAALEFYRSDNGGYPDALPTCEGDPLKGVVANGTENTEYMKEIPCDPSGGSAVYTYNKGATGSQYCIIACLENPNDKDAANGTCGVTTCADGYLQTNP